MDPALQLAMLTLAATTPVRATAPRRTAQPVSISSLALDANSGDVIAMVVQASFDSSVRANHYLPPCMDEAAARRYCETTDGVVLRLGSRPVGVLAVLHDPHPGEGVEIPAGSVEFEMWVLPEYRGQGMRWFPLVASWLAQRFHTLVGVTWSTNETAIALMRWAGWKWLGRTFWRGEGEFAEVQGSCEVFLYDLTPHRARAA
jgi:RimJ/RimL family protein N-acetyltransferase